MRIQDSLKMGGFHDEASGYTCLSSQHPGVSLRIPESSRVEKALPQGQQLAGPTFRLNACVTGGSIVRLDTNLSFLRSCLLSETVKSDLHWRTWDTDESPKRVVQLQDQQDRSRHSQGAQKKRRHHRGVTRCKEAETDEVNRKPKDNVTSSGVEIETVCWTAARDPVCIKETTVAMARSLAAR